MLGSGSGRHISAPKGKNHQKLPELEDPKSSIIGSRACLKTEHRTWQTKSYDLDCGITVTEATIHDSPWRHRYCNFKDLQLVLIRFSLSYVTLRSYHSHMEICRPSRSSGLDMSQWRCGQDVAWFCSFHKKVSLVHIYHICPHLS